MHGMPMYTRPTTAFQSNQVVYTSLSGGQNRRILTVYNIPKADATTSEASVKVTTPFKVEAPMHQVREKCRCLHVRLPASCLGLLERVPEITPGACIEPDEGT